MTSIGNRRRRRSAADNYWRERTDSRGAGIGLALCIAMLILAVL